MANDQEQLLTAVPHRNKAAKVESFEDGVLVWIPLKRPWFACAPLTWILPLSSHRRVQLDAMGAWVLEQCNGGVTIERLIDRVAEKYKLSFREARTAVLQFMKMLHERGIVAIAVKHS